MPKQTTKFTPKFILPVLLVLGIVFGLTEFIFNIPAYFELISTKVTYPASYEFKIYDRILKRYIRNGLVDYATLRQDPDLNACYQELKHINPSKLQGKLETLCFWINTYNFLTMKCIADCYPIERLRQEAAVKTFIVGGKLYSLNQIKDDVLPQLISTSDWRAIFLICNGSISAPFLADHAFSASHLDDEFEPAMKRFVLSHANYSIDERQRTFSISPFYKTNIRYIDQVYPSPFDMVNEELPRNKQVDLDNVYRNYAMPYDWRINDVALLRDYLKKRRMYETDDQTIERLGKEASDSLAKARVEKGSVLGTGASDSNHDGRTVGKNNRKDSQ